MFVYIDKALELVGIILIVCVGVVLVTISEVLGWLWWSIRWVAQQLKNAGDKTLSRAKKANKAFFKAYRRGKYHTTKHGKKGNGKKRRK